MVKLWWKSCRLDVRQTGPSKHVQEARPHKKFAHPWCCVCCNTVVFCWCLMWLL